MTASEDIEILAFVRNVLQTNIQRLPAARKELLAKKKRLLLKRAKIKSTGRVNFVHMIIGEELRRIEASLAHLDRQEEVGAACLATLDEYSEDWTPPPAPPDTGFSMTDLRFPRGYTRSPFE